MRRRSKSNLPCHSGFALHHLKTRYKQIKSVLGGQMNLIHLLSIVLSLFFVHSAHAEWASKDIVSINHHEGQVCAITRRGTVECKGSNSRLESFPRLDLENVVQVSGACAVQADNVMKCWYRGNWANLETTNLLEIKDVVSVSTKESNICTLSSTGKPTCTGNEVSKIPTTIGSAIAIATGWSHACVIDQSNSVQCWGSNKFEQLNVPAGIKNPIQITATNTATCVLDLQGTVTCWGGIHDRKNMLPPSSNILGRVTQISGGTFHMCALNRNAQVKCWGDLPSGIIETPEKLDSEIVVEVSAGRNNTCALTGRGAVKCWGWDKIPFEAPKKVKSISASDKFLCSLDKRNRAECWGGDPFFGISGPIVIENVKSISAGKDHVCGIYVTDQPFCKGKNLNGETDIPSTLKDVVQIEVSDELSCALDKRGYISCWGQRASSLDLKAIPQSTQIAVNKFGGLCALTKQGAVNCWGSPTTPHYEFAPPTTMKNIVQVTLGANHSCVLDKDGTATCFESPSANNPHKPDLAGVAKLSTYDYQSCALYKDNSVKCWGMESYPGFELLALNKVPAQTEPIIQLSMGGNYACSVDKSQKLDCWGYFVF